MKAEETVIDLGKTDNESLRVLMERILLEQAQISFKTGFDEGFDKGCVFNYHEAKSQGIRQVVEWIREFIADFDKLLVEEFDKKYSVHSTVSHTPKGLLKVFDEWQAQLKEWGISEN